MSTDQTYHHKVLLFDLETAPRLAYYWQAKQVFIPQEMAVHDTFLLSWAAKWLDRKKVMSDVLTTHEAKQQSDERIVSTLAELIAEADTLVAHNLKRFDLPVMNTRLVSLGLEPLGPVSVIDTLALARKTFRFSHNNLDYLARILQVDTKDHTEWELWQRCYHGDEAALRRMVRYNRQDVRVLEQVFAKLRPQVKGLPRMVDAGSVESPICPSCGGTKLQRRGERYYRTQASTFKMFQCRSELPDGSICLRWSRARKAEPDKKIETVPV